MNVKMWDKVPISETTTHHFWESEVEVVRKKTIAPNGKKFKYFDDKGIFNFVFLLWMYRWVWTAARRYLDAYMIHPLPLADQTIIWYPIFSRHVSDGIASLEAYEYMGKDGRKRAPKPVKHILWRAILLTFWKRLLIILIGIVIMNAISMSVAVFLHKLLELLYRRDFRFITLFSLAFSIILIELIKELCMDHINYYLQRAMLIIDSCLRITIFQHGLCYRRSQFGNFQAKGGACKSIIHSCSGEDLCSSDPLLCPARRYKNNEVTPKIYSLILNDSYFIPFFIDFVTGSI
ncbi:conserved hypothetical protein [Theileria equi strain WA]|uniref:Uncharacterized protein n=1 Tax=Theileria equi strain WA TaxID=1537102 RepID=L1LE96_THEEQ|nr:conserved hypothetical protein [Theileria equi strain WA]EKX73609.1 conserved hypothetical protein [Theileria equi strain WA]|eukprot:XP_004833061.1 conserved hypothetical protein [Theileria equi strain WA]